MGVRGRKSAASQNVVSLAHVEQRPAPPADLTDAESQEWISVVNRMPGDWFPRETHGTLKVYVRSVSRADLLASQLGEFEPEWLAHEEGLKRYALLLKLAAEADRMVLMSGTKLRLTPQSRYDEKRAATAVRKGTDRKPWQVDG